MKFPFTRAQLIPFLLIGLLFFSLIAAINLAGRRQDIRNRASGSAITLSLYPSTETLAVGESKVFELKATFTGGSSSEKLNYFKTEINFSPSYIAFPDNTYIDTSSSGFDKIFRVDGPVAGNETGKIRIELGVNLPGTGPTTASPITIARLTLKGVAQTPAAQTLTLATPQVINQQTGVLPVTMTNASYTVGGTATISPTPTTVGNPSPTGGSGTSAVLSLDPSQVQYNRGENKVFDLKAKFTNGSTSEKINYFKTTLAFSTTYLNMPEGVYVDTSMSGLSKVFRVDGPTAANQSGKIVIEIGASVPGTGPTTANTLTLARITLKGIANTSAAQNITFDSAQMINNQEKAIALTTTAATYQITGGTGVTPTPTVVGDPQCVLAYGGTCRNACLTNETQIQAGCFPDTICCRRNIPGDTTATLYFDLPKLDYKKGEDKVLDLKASFNNGSASQKVNYFKTTVVFSNTYLNMPAGVYVDTSMSGLAKVFRVDGPTAANQTGKIVIELGANTPGTGPTTGGVLTIARITFRGITKTPSPQSITIDQSQIVDNEVRVIPYTTQATSYSITDETNGNNLIDIGDKQSLTIHVSGGGDKDTPFVKFKVKVLSENAPLIKARLKVVDLVKWARKASVTDSCYKPVEGEYFFEDISLEKVVGEDDQNIYQPIPASKYFVNGQEKTVTDDGWVGLYGVTPGKRLMLSVKGEKHRDMQMTDQIELQEGKVDSQAFDWTANYLEVGDLHDPNNADRQDCTVNSIDISLVISRLNKDSDTDLFIADLNYDGVINGNDISQIVHTLSAKPDDDL